MTSSESTSSGTVINTKSALARTSSGVTRGHQATRPQREPTEIAHSVGRNNLCACRSGCAENTARTASADHPDRQAGCSEPSGPPSDDSCCDLLTRAALGLWATSLPCHLCRSTTPALTTSWSGPEVDDQHPAVHGPMRLDLAVTGDQKTAKRIAQAGTTTCALHRGREVV